ncbi:MAG: PA0069 family radical SAM protein [Rhodospirillaceae bacterium]|jgi:DNA repair photolyase|nr:PA0069 family radical SAM protein [Rhodospirillales bacterium]MBT3906335.1 PA0069 family radical SAM protein [Rhodospirillaceae bacterium]MBT4700323.1 PA0069 family radical SAM protein [Rhodospirillaceae bacterium]MBT5034619.1 PA0069 family radical SAM protein [Rhodospirillaceae bacterium]MBT6218295.1 PA0069 family radical SAM protein [Rhodospirillaceae bacterium]
MVDHLPAMPRKGRGAVANATGRYESEQRYAVDDGWQLPEDNSLPVLKTTVGIDAAKSIISRNSSPDLPFDQSINPYKGCEHGCIYCYARPTHAYLGLSPGLDFETRLFAKPNAPDLLKKELRKPSYQCKSIMLGANTDPYQPIERDHKITRDILKVLSDFNHPVSITTKSDLVLRDLDILTDMAARNLVSVAVSVTTLDGKLARAMEPRAPRPDKRLAALEGLNANGIPTTVLASPMIPFLNDWELERILEASSNAGAEAAHYILLRLPLELREMFAEWLETHTPGKANHVLNQLRESRNGTLYISDFSTRMQGTGTHADLLAKRFRLASKRHGLNSAKDGKYDLDTSRFIVPPDVGDQLELL